MSEASMSREDAEHLFGTDNVERLREDNARLRRALRDIARHGSRRMMLTGQGWESLLKTVKPEPETWLECCEIMGKIAIDALEEIKQ